MHPWVSKATWANVADELRSLRQAGFGHLLTEDTVRFATVRALAAAGVDPATMRYEAPHPAIRGSRIDLVIGAPPTVLIELKYPREPAANNAAWTMVYGEVLKDFYRLAAYPHDAERIFVYAESPRLRSYISGAAGRYGLDIGSDTVSLGVEQASAMPKTVADILGVWPPDQPVTARNASSRSSLTRGWRCTSTPSTA